MSLSRQTKTRGIKKNPKPKRQPRIKENPKKKNKETKSPMHLGPTKTQSRKPKKN
jgi:hypothetical protein